MRIPFFLLICAFLEFPAFCQTIGRHLGDETKFYAETKQVNQFFRRFNHEEDKRGKKYEHTDKRYRSNEGRRQFLQILFDGANNRISNKLKKKFVNDIATSAAPQFLDFHGGNWFAEVKTIFSRNGMQEEATLFLKLEKENLGSKWGIFDFYYPPFDNSSASNQHLSRPSPQEGVFLHPLSHELDFMNLQKVFAKSSEAGLYTTKDASDQVFQFIKMIEDENWQFQSVGEVKFHFFQVPGWYFELEEFNRPGLNTGWLISDLIEVPLGQDNVLRNYILEGKKA